MKELGVMVAFNAPANDPRTMKMATAMKRVFREFLLIGTYEQKTPSDRPIERSVLGLQCVSFPDVNFRLSRSDEGADQRVEGQHRESYEKLCAEISSYVGRMAPACVHTNGIYALPVGYKLKQDKACSGPITWIHDVRDFDQVQSVDQALHAKHEGIYLSCVDHITTTSNEFEEELRTRFPNLPPTTVVFNSPEVYPERSRECLSLREALGLIEGQLAVYSGEVNAESGLERMIPVLERAPNLHFCILTESKNQVVERVVEKANAAGVQQRLMFHPYAENDVVSLLKEADVGVIPLERSGDAHLSLPSNLFEYVFSGIPVVCQKLNALENFIKRWGVGQTADFDDPDAVTSAIKALMTPDAKQKVGDRYKDIISEYSWEVQAAKLVRLYLASVGIAGPAVVNPVTGSGVPQDTLRVLHGLSGAAGQPGALAKALDRIDGITARSLQVAPSIYEFDADLVYPMRSNAANNAAQLIRAVVDDFDIFHLHYRSFFHDPKNLEFPTGLDLLLLKAAGKKIVVHFRGTEARLQSVFKRKSPFHYVDDDREGTISAFPEPEKRRFIEYVCAVADRVFVPDPELQTYVPEAEVIERAIDLNDWSYVGLPANSRPLVVHAPSRRGVKGTEEIVRAVAELRERGMLFDFEIVEDMPQAEARRIYERADVIIDQLKIGWYGVLAVEAMALGKPVIAFIRDDLAEKYGDGLPVVNANPRNISDVLGRILSDYAERERLSKTGREFCERVHSADIIARKLRDHYIAISEQPKVMNVSSALDHLLRQYHSLIDLRKAKTIAEARAKTAEARAKTAEARAKTAEERSIKSLFRGHEK